MNLPGGIRKPLLVYFRVMIVLLIFLLTGCRNSVVEPVDEHENPGGYFYDYTTLPTELPLSLADTSGVYKMWIQREIVDTRSRFLIEKAEACFPPEDAVRACYFFTQPDSLCDEPLWWCDVFDGVKIAYCISGSSVAYYMDLIRDFQVGDFSGAENYTFASASLVYEARVRYHESVSLADSVYNDVYVVEQYLKWNDYLGNMGALMFMIERRVIFDKKGDRLITVIGDGYPMVIVAKRGVRLNRD